MYSSKPLAAHYPILNNITLPTHTALLVSEVEYLCVRVLSFIGSLWWHSICLNMIFFSYRRKGNSTFVLAFVHDVRNGDRSVEKVAGENCNECERS